MSNSKPQSLPQYIKNEEAIHILDNIISEINTLYSLTDVRGHKFARVIDDLQNIKKDIPLKPLNHKYCPTCGRYLDRVGGLVDDCLYCNQKIDWRNKDS